MIKLLACGTLHLRLDGFVPGDDSMPLIQRLGGNFAAVIDTHEASSMSLLFFAEIRFGDISCRIVPR